MLSVFKKWKGNVYKCVRRYMFIYLFINEGKTNIYHRAQFNEFTAVFGVSRPNHNTTAQQLHGEIGAQGKTLAQNSPQDTSQGCFVFLYLFS